MRSTEQFGRTRGGRERRPGRAKAVRILGQSLLACAVSGFTPLVRNALGAEYDCLITPYQVVEIRSPATGLLERVAVDRGDFVQKGQLIAQLESSVETAASNMAQYRSQMAGPIRSRESRVEFATRKFGRKDQLHDQKFVSAQERDEAKTELGLAEAELHEARENKHLSELEATHASAVLSLRSIRSPFSGIVVERALNPGEVVELGQGQKPIVKLAQLDPLRVEVILPVAVYGSIKDGGKAEIVPEKPIGGSYTAVVKRVDKVVDAASGTFGVRLEMPNPNLKLPAGIKCKAKF
jgi:RND family efflux transporter MFP subunit